MVSEQRYTFNKSSLFIAVIINVAILIFFLQAFGIRPEVHDDLAIAVLIQNQYFYIRFINYFLCVFSYGFQYLVPFVNGWTLLQLILSFISFCTLSYVFVKQGARFINLAFAVALPFVFAFDHYCEPQFTKTSALLAIAGMIALLYYFKNRETSSLSLLVIGFLLFLFGSWYRFDNIYPILGLAAIWIVFQTVRKHPKGWSILVKSNIKTIITFSIIMMIVFGTHGISNLINLSTPELRAHWEFHSVRSDVMDYSGFAISNEKNRELYASLNLTEDDVKFLNSSLLDSDDLIGIEVLKKIVANNAAVTERPGAVFIEMLKTLWQSARSIQLRGVHIVFILLILVLFLLFATKRWRIFSIVFCLCAIAGYFYLFYMGRPIYRATYVIDLAAISFLLFSITPESFEPRLQRIQQCAIVSIVVFISFATVFSPYRHIQSQPPPDSDMNANILYEHMEANKEDLFVFNQTYHFYATWDYYQMPLLPLPKDIFANGYELSRWQTRSPFNIQKLSRFGLSNIYSDAIDNEHVYFVDNGAMGYKESFFNNHFAEEGSVIEFELIDVIGGFGLWQIKTVPDDA